MLAVGLATKLYIQSREGPERFQTLVRRMLKQRERCRSTFCPVLGAVAVDMIRTHWLFKSTNSLDRSRYYDNNDSFKSQRLLSERT